MEEADLYEIIKENLALVRVTIGSETRAFTFAHGQKSFLNVIADEDAMPLSYLEEPIESNDAITAMGSVLPSYPIMIFFGDQIEPDESTEEHRKIIKPMRGAAKEVLLRFIADKRIAKVENARRADVMNVFNVNCSGVFLFVTLTPKEDNSICLP